MADSPRWCEHCQAWGDHHSDRCPADPTDYGMPAEFEAPVLDVPRRKRILRLPVRSATPEGKESRG